MDPMKLNPKKLAREIRNEIKAYKIREPELAQEMEDWIFKENEVDHALNDCEIDESEIKAYPGSDKGRKPEDDPEFYSQWFVKNQPKMFQKGDGSEMGITKRFITATN